MKQKPKQAKWPGKRKWPTLRGSESGCFCFCFFWCDMNVHHNKIVVRIMSICSRFFSYHSFLFLCSLIQRLEGKSKDISKIAADITQNVSLRQGMERKKVIQHIRGLYKTDLSASRHWQELVQQLTHDRWAWKSVCYKGLHNIRRKYNNYSKPVMIDVLIVIIYVLIF